MALQPSCITIDILTGCVDIYVGEESQPTQTMNFAPDDIEHAKSTLTDMFPAIETWQLVKMYDIANKQDNSEWYAVLPVEHEPAQ